MVQVSLTVNGKARRAHVEPRLLLVHFLREELRLTGTHVGCDTSQCGACTVLIDGRSAKSCTVFAVQADGSAVTTIEGIGRDGELHLRLSGSESAVRTSGNLPTRASATLARDNGAPAVLTTRPRTGPARPPRE